MKKKISVIWWIVAGVSIIFLIVLLTNNTEDIGEKFPHMGNKHIDEINTPHAPYNSNPPTSGPHVEYTAPWGISEEIIPDEVQVHNLEDGGVVIQYNPNKVGDDEIEQLEQIVKSASGKSILMAPRYDMDYYIALTAWRRLLSLDMVDETQINAFIDAYAGKDNHSLI